MFNKKKPKTSLTDIKCAFMVAAITSVLVMGTGFSSTQSFGIDYNGIGNLDMFNGLTQSAECLGLGNDCSEDNRVTNNLIAPTPDPTPDPTPIPTCEECFTGIFTAEEIVAIEANFGTVQQNCDNLEAGTSVSESVIIAQLSSISISNEDSIEFIECLESLGFNVTP